MRRERAGGNKGKRERIPSRVSRTVLTNATMLLRPVMTMQGQSRSSYPTTAQRHFRPSRLAGGGKGARETGRDLPPSREKSETSVVRKRRVCLPSFGVFFDESFAVFEQNDLDFRVGGQFSREKCLRASFHPCRPCFPSSYTQNSNSGSSTEVKPAAASGDAENAAAPGVMDSKFQTQQRDALLKTTFLSDLASRYKFIGSTDT